MLISAGQGLSLYGGHKDYTTPPIAFSPNPAKCRWNGPNLADFNCTSCSLGYETVSATNSTCVRPAFGPYREWRPNYARLTLHDTQPGAAIGRDTSPDGQESVGNILAGHTYTIPAPMLEPKDQMFSGYEQPYTKIHYELDFTRGADVDIGCGTTIVGDTTKDATVSKSVFTHPNSMHRLSYQLLKGRGNPGFYPQVRLRQPRLALAFQL